MLNASNAYSQRHYSDQHEEASSMYRSFSLKWGQSGRKKENLGYETKLGKHKEE